MLILAFLYYNATPQARTESRASWTCFKTGFLASVCLRAASRSGAPRVVCVTNKQRRDDGWLVATIVLGGIFIVGQGIEYWHLSRVACVSNSNLFATTFFTLTGFHGLHVCRWADRDA